MIEPHSLSFFLLCPRMPPVNSDSSLLAIFLTLVWRQSLQRSTHRHQPLAMLHASISSSARSAALFGSLHDPCPCIRLLGPRRCSLRLRRQREAGATLRETPRCDTCPACVLRFTLARRTSGTARRPFPNPMSLPPTSGGRPRARCRTPSTPFPLASLIV